MVPWAFALDSHLWRYAEIYFGQEAMESFAFPDKIMIKKIMEIFLALTDKAISLSNSIK